MAGETKHTLYVTGDADAPAGILDRNGEVTLGLCRVCGQGEADLAPSCPGLAPFTFGDEKAEEAKVEHAVVLVGEYDTRIVFGRGVIIESDKEAGLGGDEAGPTYLAPKENGLWAWEGTPGWRDNHGPYGDDDGGESIYEGRGAWRRLTDEEALKVARGDFSFFGPEVHPAANPNLEEPHHG